MWLYPNGERTTEVSRFDQSLPFNNPDLPIPTTEEVVGDRIAMAYQVYLEPSRKKGEARAIQDPLDYKASQRNAWIYLPAGTCAKIAGGSTQSK